MSAYVSTTLPACPTCGRRRAAGGPCCTTKREPAQYAGPAEADVSFRAPSGCLDSVEVTLDRLGLVTVEYEEHASARGEPVEVFRDVTSVRDAAGRDVWASLSDAEEAAVNAAVRGVR